MKSEMRCIFEWQKSQYFFVQLWESILCCISKFKFWDQIKKNIAKKLPMSSALYKNLFLLM